MITAKIMKSGLMKSRKAQITVFVIIGILLVFSSGIYFYIKNQSTNVQAPEVLVEKVPSEFQPVSDYVTGCIKTSAESALVKIGEGGGYIDFRAKNVYDPTNRDANGVKFPGTDFPGGKEIPYWYYLKGDNKGTTFTPSTEQPYLTREDKPIGSKATSMEEQLENCTTIEFIKCIDEFNAFVGQGYRIEQMDDPGVDVVIGENDVVFKVNYPLVLSRGGNEVKSSRYIITVPLKLKKIYLLAKDIAGAQNYFNFLEKDSVSMLSAYSGTKSGDLPPFTDLDIGPSKSWSKTQSAEKFYQIIQRNTFALQVQGSRNYRAPAFYDPTNPETEMLAKLRTGIYQAKVLPNQALLNSSDFVSNFDVSFFVPDAKQYFDIPNCHSSICKGTTISAMIVQITTYNFIYDYSYPVVIEITDPEFTSSANPDRKGFTFRFASEVNVRSSEPVSAEAALKGSSTPEMTMLCDDDKRTSGDIKFTVKDSVTKKYLDGVQIQFVTPDAICDINITNTNTDVFTTRLPAGVTGASLRFTKEGYLGKTISNIAIKSGEEKEFTAYLKPFVDVTAYARYKAVRKTSVWEFQPESTYRMRENDKVLITLTRVDEEGDEPYSIPILFEAGTSAFAPEPSTNLSLVEGKYIITANVMSGQSFTIPKKRFESCSGGLFSKCTSYYIPEEDYTVTASQVGGLDTADGLQWVVNGKELRENPYLVFKTVYIDFVGTRRDLLVMEDLEQMNKMDKYTADYWNSLKPEFTKMLMPAPKMPFGESNTNSQGEFII